MSTTAARWDLVAEERHAVADLAEGLTPEQWATPSLCAGWTVKDVVAHLTVGPTATLREVGAAMLAARGRFHVANRRLVANRAALGADELVALLREHAGSRFHPPGHDWRAPLADLLVHRHDVLAPLGLPDDRPAAPYGPALELLTSKRAATGFTGPGLPRLTYVATDLDLALGSGPVVEAPAAALALATVRRTVRLDELTGPGAAALRAFAATRG